MSIRLLLAIPALLAAPAALAAQDSPGSGSFQDASGKVRKDLEASVAELARLRNEIAAEKIPLSNELSALEAELSGLREEFQKTARLLDARRLDLSTFEKKVEKRKDEANYISTLLTDYVREFESRLHVAELQRYETLSEAALLAPDNKNLSAEEIYERQLALVGASIDRMEEALGGTRFQGTAVVEDGLVKDGTFVMIGPAALFRSEDGRYVGSAEQRWNSLEPTQVAYLKPENLQAASALATRGSGDFPLDATLGSAHKMEATQETLLEHVMKGGVVMYPIFTLAGLALLVALYKWVYLLFTRKPSRKKIDALLRAVDQHDEAAARERVAKMPGPAGRMLAVGVEHLREPRDLIEELMYENVLAARLKMQRFLPFIAICAASAPLLGLLGTVTGIIKTFKMITVVGAGDVKTLSGGISEALITTEFGLIVAIPSLLLHALLSRKAKSVIDQMEKCAISFVNRVSKARPGEPPADRATLEDRPQPASPEPPREAELVGA